MFVILVEKEVLVEYNQTPQYHINRLTRDLEHWIEWCKEEQRFIDKCTDPEALILMKNRLASGQRNVESLKKALEVFNEQTKSS